MARRQQPAGRAGEAAAARYLKKLGCKILQRNYTSPAGEIDLIALHAGEIVFVEVKSRAPAPDAPPESTVNLAKQRRICRAAEDFLRRKRLPDADARFDVITVLDPNSKDPTIEHFRDAFPLRK